jgi:hypothetical protein
MKKQLIIILCLFVLSSSFIFALDNNVIFEAALSKPSLNIGEMGKVSLSVANLHKDKDINIDLTLTVGNGLEIKSVEVADQCGGSICKLDRKILASGGKEDIIFSIEGISGTESIINANINYYLDGKKYTEFKELQIIIHDCGNGIKEKGETSETCCVDAGCPSETFFYEYGCSRKHNFCEKKLKSIIILGFIIILIIILSSLIKHIITSHPHPHPHPLPLPVGPGDRTGTPWERKEIYQLKKEFYGGYTIEKMAKIHRRDQDAIKHRLIKLGLLGFIKTKTKPPNHGNIWTYKENNKLKSLFLKNKNIQNIARSLYREPNAILHQLIELRIISNKELLKYRRRG